MFPMSQCGLAPFEVLPATPAVAIVRNLIVGTPLNVLGSCSWTWEHRVWWSRMFHVLVNIVLKSNFDARLVPACPDSYALRIQPTRCQFWLFRFHDARNNMNRLAPNVHPMYSRILFFVPTSRQQDDKGWMLSRFPPVSLEPGTICAACVCLLLGTFSSSGKNLRAKDLWISNTAKTRSTQQIRRGSIAQASLKDFHLDDIEELLVPNKLLSR